jgi:glycosyltransferase involved in cell wall biosynthesis
MSSLVADPRSGRSPSATPQAPRILALTPIYPWPGNPAEGIFVERQLRQLVRLGHTVRVVNYHPGLRGLPRALTRLSWLRYHPRSLTWPALQHGIPVVHPFHPQKRLRGDVVPAIADVVIRAIEHTPGFTETDIVYAHWLWTGGAVALRVREHFGWPVAAIARGSELHRWQTVHPYCRGHVQDVLDRADVVFANCVDLRDRAVAMRPALAGQVSVLYNGCDLTDFSPVTDRDPIRAALALRPDTKYLLCCATIAEHKGALDLADAWRTFSADHPDWHLLLAGGTLDRTFAATVRQRVGARCTMLGPVPADRIVDYLRAVDGYVQPSRLEGLSNATMEAMAAGLPVIATDAGSQRELLGDGSAGWLVPTLSPQRLVAAMRELAADPAHARALGGVARRRMVTHFDALAHARSLSTALTDVIRARPDVMRPDHPPATAPHQRA